MLPYTCYPCPPLNMLGRSADVVAATCVGAGDPYVQTLIQHFDTQRGRVTSRAPTASAPSAPAAKDTAPFAICVIDEAAQARTLLPQATIWEVVSSPISVKRFVRALSVCSGTTSCPRVSPGCTPCRRHSRESGESSMWVPGTSPLPVVCPGVPPAGHAACEPDPSVGGRGTLHSACRGPPAAASHCPLTGGTAGEGALQTKPQCQDFLQYSRCNDRGTQGRRAIET